MHHVTISPKFQVVIPRVVRERLGLRPIASQTPCGIVSPVNLPPSRFSCGPPAQRTETNFQSAQRKRLLLRQVFPGPCRSLLPAPPRAFGAVLAALLVAGVVPADLRANTTLDSGTTTLSTSTDYGNILYVGKGDLAGHEPGTATLKVNAGGHATNNSSFLGYHANDFGTVTVESGGRWTNSGGLRVGLYGRGKLNVTGGSVTSGGNCDIGYLGTGTVTVESGGTWDMSDGTLPDWGVIANGMLYVGNFGTGTLNVNGGRVTNPDGYLGYSDSSVGTVTVTSGTWANSGDLTVSYQGRGTLNVNGGRVTNTNGYIGRSADGHGTATVRSGTWANSGDLTVGHYSRGTLNVTGGSVTNTNGYLGNRTATFGNDAGHGTATVSSGTWANSGDLTVGYEGTGTLNVTGGNVTNTSGYIGFIADSSGTATVSSGTWANSGGLAVGNSGTGTLKVTGGTVTNDAIGYIGRYADGHGTATVSSGTWANGNLAVGNYGTGILNVTGGSVTNTNGYIGRFADSDGTATVSSGTWANSGDLTVGDEGTGSLTMSGGLVTVGGTLLRRAGGTIHLNSGGTLQIGTGTTGGVLGNNLTNNGTLIFNRSDAYTYGGIISGTGSVTKQGGGTLTLGAANSYSGLTTISAGTLALSGIGSIGKGGLGLGTTGSPGVFDLSGLTAGTYSLPATGNLAGVGTLSGSGKSLAVLGSFLPGNSPGTVTLGSGLSLDLSNSGSSVFEITDPAYTAGTYDLVNGDGSVVFGGILNLAFSGGSFADGTNVLQLFANTGGRSGNFSAVNATGLAAGQSATFNPVTGFITVVPEPSIYAMALAGLACGGYSMLRRRNRA